MRNAAAARLHRQGLDMGRRRVSWRYIAIGLALSCAYVAAFAATVHISLHPPEQVAKQARGNTSSYRSTKALRGSILDRSGAPLATTLRSDTLAVEPGRFAGTDEEWRAIAGVFGWDRSYRERRKRWVRSKARRGLLFLQRKIEPAHAQAISRLSIPGLRLVQESIRHFSGGPAMATVIGLTNIDGRGQEGLEYAWEHHLRPEDGRTKLVVDARRTAVRPAHTLSRARAGGNLVLTLDSQLQQWAYQQLRAGALQAQAKAASMVVMDPHSGEVLALASWPSYDPYHRRNLVLQPNRPVADLIEPGSTFKPFVVATALRTGDWGWSDPIDTSPGFVAVGGRRFADLRNLGKLSLRQSLVRSSQVAAVQLAMALPSEVLLQGLRDFGFGAHLQLGLPVDPPGFLPAPRSLGQVGQATLGFGYGVAASAVQLARAYSVFANGGTLPPVRLIQGLTADEPRRVLAPQVAQGMRDTLEEVVRSGTGRLAAVPGYRIGGKTGTSHLLGSFRTYDSDRYRAIFAGFAGGAEAMLVAVVVVEEPHSDRYFGGQVAAPLFSSYMRLALPYWESHRYDAFVGERERGI